MLIQGEYSIICVCPTFINLMSLVKDLLLINLYKCQHLFLVMLKIKSYGRRHAQFFNFGSERNIMNKLSIIIRGVGQLMIHKSSRKVDLVIMARLCASENLLCQIAYSKIHSILSPNKNSYSILTDIISC